MRVTREYQEKLTEFICSSLYVYNHAKNSNESLTPDEITDRSMKEYTGMYDYMNPKFIPQLPLLRNYTMSIVGILIQEIENIEVCGSSQHQLELMMDIKEYITAASDGSMSRNNSEALAAELLDKL